jgi:deoxycytidine triphosphate deaminase
MSCKESVARLKRNLLRFTCPKYTIFMVILRRNFKEAQIEVNPDETEEREEVCVDLSVGESYMKAGSSERLTMGESLELKPGRCLIVKTAEQVTVPRNVLGLLCSKGSLAARGFLVPNTKIDPLFSGKLDVAIFNGGKRSLAIKRGMKFCSIVFQKVEGNTASKIPRTGPSISTDRRGKLYEICDEIKANLTTIIICVGSTAISTAVSIWFSMKHH